MPILTTALLILAVFATSTLSGVFGMVGGMVLLWLLLLMMPVATAIAIQGVIQLVANGSRAYFARAFVEWKIVGFAMAGLGFAAAVLALVSYTPTLAVVSIAIGLMPILVWLPMRWAQLDASRPGHAMLCGFISGALNIGVGVSGPVIDIFFVRTEHDRRQIIATKATIQVLSHLAKIVFYSQSLWLLSKGETAAVAIAAPFSVIGSIVGHRILLRLTNHGFRQGLRWLVTGVGAFYFVQGLYLLASTP
ncbi:sulfite exporter TauE/SafE family protein [Mesorhizobium sp. BE184]|uniref:sulfite exporter TauE/SafE family protein n=1 Tax=Mesorhizobium sp. BE184 TaxID=2817714 RepID=UPI002857C6B0|nr:sulfite exporter TauE/SafE family protein [Mesorhizobium sp. BE184]MDR7033692.1 putative membrane protein YfcA [Mesorhizobium sp. BE184]